MKDKIIETIQESIRVKQAALENQELLQGTEEAVEKIIKCFRNNGKVLLCGNGGSAADAQHIAAELSGRFNYDRDPFCRSFACKFFFRHCSCQRL